MKKHLKKFVVLVIVIALVVGLGFAFQSGAFSDLFQGKLRKSPSIKNQFGGKDDGSTQSICTDLLIKALTCDEDYGADSSRCGMIWRRFFEAGCGS